MREPFGGLDIGYISMVVIICKRSPDYIVKMLFILLKIYSLLYISNIKVLHTHTHILYFNCTTLYNFL